MGGTVPYARRRALLQFDAPPLCSYNGGSEVCSTHGDHCEDLGQLEKDIRQLKIEYDQYFGGGRKRRDGN